MARSRSDESGPLPIAARGDELRTMRSLLLLCGASLAAAQQPATPPQLTAATLMRQVEVRRTTNGVPHIKAENLIAAGYAEAYVQSEDYGARVAMSLLKERGELA